MSAFRSEFMVGGEEYILTAVIRNYDICYIYPIYPCYAG